MRLLLSKKSFFLLASLVLVVFALYHLVFNERIDTVVEGRVYRSAQLSGKSFQKIIDEKGIRTIINLRGGSKDSGWYIGEREIAKKNNIRLYDISLSAHELPEYGKLISLVEALQTSEKPILIHCRRGSDRTGMASALALALEKDPPLSYIEKQFSWRYGVLPVYHSIGPYFFSKYEQWLGKNGRAHNKGTLLYWIRNEYVDNKGNLEFSIDHVNGMALKDGKVRVDNNTEVIAIDGWAFDTRTKSPVDGLSVAIDNRASSRAVFLNNRPDIVEHFGLGKEYLKNFIVGWKAEFKSGDMTRGCHKISMKLVKGESNILDVPTGFQLCL